MTNEQTNELTILSQELLLKLKTQVEEISTGIITTHLPDYFKCELSYAIITNPYYTQSKV